MLGQGNGGSQTRYVELWMVLTAFDDVELLIPDIIDLSEARVKNLVMGGMMATSTPTYVADDVGYRVLEQELELQLALLKEHTPEPSLFPAAENDEIATALPHLNDPSTVSGSSQQSVASVVDSVSRNLAPTTIVKGTILEESNLEPLMICVAIVALVFLPQLLS
jgi:hypothetical protein